MKAQNYLLKSLDNLMDCVALISTARSELTKLSDQTLAEYRANSIYLQTDLKYATNKIEEAYGLIENILIHIDKPF